MNLLKEKIVKEIENKGFLSLDEYIDRCLYDENFGYYRAKNVIGEKGDFITAPEISQIFGEIIAIFIINKIQNFSDIKIDIIELGAGNGTLADDVLRVLSKFKNLYQNISYKIYDVSEFLIKKQQEKLAKYQGKTSWISDLEKTKNKNLTIFIANEFFDALPIKQYIFEDFKWFERIIKYNKPKDKFYFDKIIAENLPKKLQKFTEKKKPKNNSIKEFCPLIPDFIKKISDIINQNNGMLICFDYGYFHSNYGDSLQAIKSNKYTDIFSNLGESDITAHVDFEDISNELKQNGIKNIFLNQQGDFLREMGALERSGILQKNKNTKIKNKISNDVSRLIDDDKMGALFKCLIAEKF
ncbi:MAG: SAM-dependent methyltransferase [Rickettsiales bacterium]|nr:SAM-dependent methyltransferase [Rickettsiales bacterium]